MPTYRTALTGLLLLLLATGRSNAAPVLMIAVDGLRPGELTSATTADWKVPVLRSLLRNGAAAAGVRAMIPTITLPNMATLVTGTSPSGHGIMNNTRCDLKKHEDGGYLSYASDFKAETLWQAADSKGLKTANVGWTSTVGAQIDYNLPWVWHAPAGTQYALQSSLSTPGLLSRIDPQSKNSAAPYIMDDDRRAAYARRLINAYGPDLLTVFFENLDATEHRTGIDTREDRKALEHIDVLIGQLVRAARRRRPNVAVVVVSDHGFTSVSTAINLFKVFADAGFLSIRDGAVATWSARPCAAGGSAYVLLADHADADLKSRMAAFLERLRTKPDSGIDRILDRKEIGTLGGWRDADFMIVFRPGYMAAFDPAAPLRAASQLHGMHGYWPADPSMYATFIIAAKAIPLKGNLGIIDMRDIAPTVARVLGVELRTATGKSLF